MTEPGRPECVCTDYLDSDAFRQVGRGRRHDARERAEDNEGCGLVEVERDADAEDKAQSLHPLWSSRQVESSKQPSQVSGFHGGLTE